MKAKEKLFGGQRSKGQLGESIIKALWDACLKMSS